MRVTFPGTKYLLAAALLVTTLLTATSTAFACPYVVAKCSTASGGPWYDSVTAPTDQIVYFKGDEYGFDPNDITERWWKYYEGDTWHAGQTGSHSYATTGNYTATYRVKAYGLYYPDDCTVTVTVVEPPHWDPYPDGGGIASAITAPSDGSAYPCSYEVTCTASAATDQDHRHDANATPQDTYPPDTFTEPDAYTWDRSAGSWKDDDNTGQSVVWVSPSTPQADVTITLTVNDDAVKPQGETGTRNDADKQYEVQSVTVFKVDVKDSTGNLDPPDYIPLVVDADHDESVEIKAVPTPTLTGTCTVQ